MSIPQDRHRIQSVTRSIAAIAAAVVLTIAFAAPSFSSTEATASPRASSAQEVQDVAWRGRVYRGGYYGRPYSRSYYRGGYYGPRPYYRGYYGRPYGGGAVVTPWARVYW